MKSLFIKVAISGLVLCTSVNVYADKDYLQHFDPSAPVAPVIAKSVEDALHSVREAEAEAEAEEANAQEFKGMTCLFDRLPRSKVVRIEPSAQQCLVKDKADLEHTKYLLDWASKKTQKCKDKLKTQAAKKAVNAILAAASIDLTDIEGALGRWSKKLPKKYPRHAVEIAIHERFQESHSKATTVFFAYITPGILAGSKAEQEDMKQLYAYFYKITDSLADGMIDKSTFYSALRRHSADCHDIVPRTDFVARAMILQFVNFFGDLAMQNADDEDSCVTSVSALEASKDFAKGLELSFVDKLQVIPSRFIFTNQNAFARFEHFCAKAPDLFNFCASNKQATIQRKLWQDGWSYWEQKNYQTTWVDYEGYTSLRIKDDGEFTVSFLSESPYFRDGSLDRTYLGERSSELIKYAPVRGISFFIPASLKNDITGFWTAATKYLQIAGAKKIMDFGHGRIST